MDLVIRAIVLFGGVYVLLRVVGRRELAEMEPVDFILLIVLGDAIQQGLTQDDYSVTGALTTIFTIAAIQVVLGFVSFRSRRVRKLLEGEPIGLIENGRVIEKNMNHARIAPDELAGEARLSQVTSLNDVAWAGLEASGKISLISKKSYRRPPLPQAPRRRERRGPIGERNQHLMDDRHLLRLLDRVCRDPAPHRGLGPRRDSDRAGRGDGFDHRRDRVRGPS